MIKKLLILLLLCSTAFGQWQTGLKPMLGQPIDYLKSKGLVGYWSFNEGTGNKVSDLSGNGNDGTFNGTAPSWTSGKFGPAVSLPGTNEHINCGTGGSLNIAGDVTISFWINSTQNNQGTLIQRFISGGGWEGYSIEFSRTTAGKFDIYTDTGGWDGNLNSTTVHDGNWHHIAITGSGSTGTIYVDGISDGAFAYGAPSSITGEIFYIGITEGENTPLDAKIDTMMLYNRALSAYEVQQLYREPFGMFQPTFPVWWSIEGEAPTGVGQVIIIGN